MNLDEVHLCIKCNSTIHGIENYIEHRKQDCTSVHITNPADSTISNTTKTTRNKTVETGLTASIDDTFNNYTFTATEPHSEHTEKANKTSLNESYDISYELGADVFFSSLQLQSVQSNTHVISKTCSSQQILPNKLQSDHAESWLASQSGTSNHHNTETLLKAVHDISGSKKTYETLFKSLSFNHDSADEDVSDDNIEDVVDDDEDYSQIDETPAASTKWKILNLRHSPPVVPFNHTGGKWKPENRPNLRVAHSQLIQLSPNWEYQAYEASESHCRIQLPITRTGNEQHLPISHGKWLPVSVGNQYPPSDHTKGKWLPGSKLVGVPTNKNIEKQNNAKNDEYWCNICCRKLKSKTIFQHHVKTNYHVKRMEYEKPLEEANIIAISSTNLHDSLTLSNEHSNIKKQKRRPSHKHFKCELCRNVVARHHIGKHLISHYHYRHAQLNASKSLQIVLDNIHSIVLQSPFQCRPCRFYCNTEETFLHHWSSSDHLEKTMGTGIFWCSYCHFECEDNNQMRRHLLDIEHKEVLMAINRSVPVTINKRLIIACTKCCDTFRYNFELRRHIALFHDGIVDTLSTASDDYQSRFVCKMCSNIFPSKLSLQRHEKNAHSISKYFCTICTKQFTTPCQARSHRKSFEHRLRSVTNKKGDNLLDKYPKENDVSLGENKINEKWKSHMDSVKIVRHNDKQFMKNVNEGNNNTENKSQLMKRTNKCRICLEKFSSANDIKFHNNEHHSDLKFRCISCGLYFSTPQSLGHHTRHCKLFPIAKTGEIMESMEPIKWNCTDCHMSFSFESDLHFHRIHHSYGSISKNQLIPCPLCTNSFRKHSLRCHLRQHTNEKIYNCETCDTKFSRKHNLNEHLKKVHAVHGVQYDHKNISNLNHNGNDDKNAVTKYNCRKCKRLFATKYTLQEHNLTIHSVNAAKKRFHCHYENCNYITYRRASLKLHNLTHSEKTYSCNYDNCKYVGKSVHHLKRHKLVHITSEKLICCEQCNFRTKRKVHLQRHQQRQHSNERQHKCPHCDFCCNSLDNLRKHVLKTNKHIGKFMFECELCTSHPSDDASFFQSNSYREYKIHIKKEHNGIRN